MKIILLKNIDKLGKKNEVKNVADGFALNYLLPQKLAIMATEEKIKQLETVKKTGHKKEDKVNKDLFKINNKKISIIKKASGKGKLFAAISDNEIIELIKNKYKVDLNKYKFKILDHPKEIGEHQLKITVSGQALTIIIQIFKKE